MRSSVTIRTTTRRCPRYRMKKGRCSPSMSEPLTHNIRADEAGSRLDVLLALADLVPSRSAAQKLIGDGYVRVNGE
ncbi:MAG: S4 domain-containing protein, partial [Coriobacteriia bacterium]|nr:S4 domain-containing protein [Coriobacteriia bacterium]